MKKKPEKGCQFRIFLCEWVCVYGSYTYIRIECENVCVRMSVRPIENNGVQYFSLRFFFLLHLLCVHSAWYSFLYLFSNVFCIFLHASFYESVVAVVCSLIFLNIEQWTRNIIVRLGALLFWCHNKSTSKMQV